MFIFVRAEFNRACAADQYLIALPPPEDPSLPVSLTNFVGTNITPTSGWILHFSGYNSCSFNSGIKLPFRWFHFLANHNSTQLALPTLLETNWDLFGRFLERWWIMGKARLMFVVTKHFSTQLVLKLWGKQRKMVFFYNFINHGHHVEAIKSNYPHLKRC